MLQAESGEISVSIPRLLIRESKEKAASESENLLVENCQLSVWMTPCETPRVARFPRHLQCGNAPRSEASIPCSAGTEIANLPEMQPRFYGFPRHPIQGGNAERQSNALDVDAGTDAAAAGAGDGVGRYGLCS